VHGVAHPGADAQSRGFDHMRCKALLIPAVAVTALGFGAVPASAHSVGEPGTPNCFGQRVSHGSSDHKLTPKERAAGLQELVDAGFPEAVALFGEKVTVREFAWFVRTNCSDNPIVPPG
jgi:hypothetical protein